MQISSTNSYAHNHLAGLYGQTGYASQNRGKEPAARQQEALAGAGATGTPNAKAGGPPEKSVQDSQSSGQSGSGADQELTEEEAKAVYELEQRDAEVRRHEAAHKAAAGQFATGGPTFSYQTGPDGKQYAVGGEVKIDTSKISGNPEATIRKAQTIARAALAPAEPSSQDRKVAAEARKMEREAQQELARQRQEKYAQAGPAESETGQVVNVVV